MPAPSLFPSDSPASSGVLVSNSGVHPQVTHDGAPCLLLRLDAGRRIVSVNEAWQRHVRSSGIDPVRANDIGQDYLRLLAATSGAPAALAAERLLEDLPDRVGAESSGEYRCEVDGGQRCFRLDATRLSDGVAMAHTDVTTQRRTEAMLRVQTIVGDALAERQPLVSACRVVIACVCETLGWDFASLWVPSHRDQLLCANLWVDDRLAGSEFENITRTTTFERGHGLPGLVWQKQTPHWIVDLAVADRFPRLQRGRALGLKSGFAVPIQCHEQVLAVLEFFSVQERSEDMELLGRLARAGAQLGAEELRARQSLSANPSERAGRERQSRLEAMIESAPGFIATIDRAGRILFVNRVLAHRRRDEVIGSDWLSDIAPSEHAVMREKFATLLDSGAQQRHEMSVTGPDGRQLWLSVHLAPTREGDQIVGAVASVQDLTELKRAHMESMAAQHWASVGTLAAGMAHEINTPVQVLSDNLHFIGDACRRTLASVQRLAPLPRLIAEGASRAQLSAACAIEEGTEKRLAFLNCELPKAIEACKDGLERVTRIVRSLSEFATPAAPDMEPTDLNQVVETSLAIAMNEYRSVAHLATDYGQLPPVQCRPSEIVQVVRNLVLNAAHAIESRVAGSGEKGMLEIRTFREGDQAVIAIRDTGTGIPEEIRPRIFDPFFTTKEVGQGTGQGLALAWAVVKQKHQGSLTFESCVGKGTTFFVRLPVSGARGTSGEPDAKGR